MKKYLLVIWLISCCITIRAQYSIGNTGLLNIPTADMQETGTFMGGGNYLPNGMTPFNFNTGNYFINITFLSILEMSYRCTLLKTTRYDGKKGYFQQDRSMTARLRPLKEGRFHPSVVIGVDDPFKNTGNNYFGTVYGVLTKKFLHSRKGQACIDCRILYSDKRPEHTERPVWRHQLLSRLLQGNSVHGRI